MLCRLAAVAQHAAAGTAAAGGSANNAVSGVLLKSLLRNRSLTTSGHARSSATNEKYSHEEVAYGDGHVGLRPGYHYVGDTRGDVALLPGSAHACGNHVCVNDRVDRKCRCR
jgi:hypothetical protein